VQRGGATVRAHVHLVHRSRQWVSGELALRQAGEVGAERRAARMGAGFQNRRDDSIGPITLHLQLLGP
jgi:hypothetical protein